MKRSFLDSVLRGAEAMAARDPVGTLPDPELVRRFADERDPAAFAVLVRRHGPLVWGVCRNLLPADADAEDAFQATFLALVRSAATIRRTEALGGWLHGVAYRVALKARRSAARRRKRETVAAVPEPSSPVPDAAWDELQAAVHEEVCRLPDKLRLPFVLCGLQGRPQKEAAEVLGWKVGTVSGRLSEARRRLLDRLAKRGVPVGVAIGAAVLGGVAGGAGVPPSLSAKVLSAAGTPGAVSPTVLSLARGVTHVYLTRTKLLAASVVLAGLLTTGIGANVLSTAGAQPPSPADPNAEVLRTYYDALRTQKAPKDRFEYKFVPVEKPLTTTDLQKVLATADHEGWNYCGAQELAQEKSGKITPHMVFKRPRAGTADNTRAEAGISFLAADARAAEQAALLNKLKQMEAMVAEQQAQAAAAVLEAKRQAERALAARAAQNDALLKEKQVMDAKLRGQAEQALRDAEKARDEATARGAAEKATRMDLEAMKANYEDLIRKLEIDLKAKAAAGTKANDPFAIDPDRVITVVVKLTNVDGKLAATGLAKVMPQAKIVAEATSNSITLTGPAKVVLPAREVIQSKIDVKAADPTKSTGEVKTEFVTIALKHASADQVAKSLEKALGGKGVQVIAIQSSNTLVVVGPTAALADIKKMVATLDAQPGPAK